MTEHMLTGPPKMQVFGERWDTAIKLAGVRAIDRRQRQRVYRHIRDDGVAFWVVRDSGQAYTP